jgi:enamidase
MHELTGPDDAKRMVDYWAAEGMTSYKAYMNITREELGWRSSRHMHTS